MNPFATAALLVLAMSQVAQAWVALDPTPQETHFLVVQQYCTGQSQGAANKRMRRYVECMTEHAQRRFL